MDAAHLFFCAEHEDLAEKEAGGGADGEDGKEIDGADGIVRAAEISGVGCGKHYGEDNDECFSFHGGGEGGIRTRVTL